MKKRLVSLFLVLCMMTGFAPQAFALVGSLRDREKSGARFDEYSGYEVKWLENADKTIRLYVVTRPYGSDKNTYFVTVPARTTASAQEAYDMIFNKKIYQRAYFTREGSNLDWNSREVEIGGYPDSQSGFAVNIKYKLYNNRYTITTHSYIVQLDEGTENGFTAGGIVEKDKNDSGHTYGVKTDVEAGYTTHWNSYIEHPQMRYCTEMKGFSKMGHPDASEAASLYMSTAVGNTGGGFTNTATAIPGALSWVNANKKKYSSKSEAITEVMTRGYSWANPFVATSSLYNEYVEGFRDDYCDKGYEKNYMPERFSTTNGGDVIMENELNLMGAEIQHVNATTLWGFRGLYGADDNSFTPNDEITVRESAKKLGIYKQKNGFLAAPASNESALKANQQKYGVPVAVLRGDFEEKNGRYVFTAGVAALSKSVTAVWQNNGGLSVGKDGSIQLTHADLNVPTFKFFKEKSGVQDSLSLSAAEDGLHLTMKTDNNEAVMQTDIPNTKISATGATIKEDGSIVFEGKAEFSLFRGADFNMEKLSYGIKSDKFTINGIRATGSIDTAEMIGLEMASVEGTIDTIESYYHFKMELNVFDLFESEAELELARGIGGALMPNKVYLYAGSDVAKIPLVSPVVVAHISGAGGGIDNLATTFKGDFFAIPPIRLLLTGKGDVLNTIEAKANYTLGPAYYKFEAEDVNIKFLKKLNLIDEFTVYESVQGETRNYDGTNYTGLNASGGASVHISVPQSSKIIQAQGDINASAFGGLDSYTSPSKIYVAADLSGGVKGSLHFPKGWKIIGGKTIGSTSFDFYLGAQTVMNVKGTDFSGAVNSAFKNFKVYGGAKKEADWKIFKYRVYYIFPENNAGFTIKPAWKKLPEWNWEDHRPSQQLMAYSNDEGALVMMSVNMQALDAEITDNSETAQNDVYSVADDTDAVVLDGENSTAVQDSFSKDIELKADNESGALPTNATVMLRVAPTDNVDLEKFAKSLTVSKGGTNVALTWPHYDNDGAIDNEKDINAFVAEDDNSVLIGLGENAKVGDTWTVTSSLADFEASLNASTPFESLSADGISSHAARSGSMTKTVTVNNPETGTEYVLATYFGSTEGATEYAIGQQEVTDPKNISVDIPQEGTMLPTGDYFVTASLLKKTTVQIEDDETKDQEVLLPVDTIKLGTVSYTNTIQPDAPTGVTITATGNEVMQASWDEVTDADGYKVTIYQQDGSKYVDTGRGYVYDAADIESGKIDGAKLENGKFTLDMALTVNGTDIGEDSSAVKQTNKLEADKTYKVGVQAYRYLSDKNGEKIANSQVYGAEAQSNDAELPKYEPLDFKVTLKTLSGSGYSSAFVERTVTEENGVFKAAAGSGDSNAWYVTPSTDTNADYTITRVDTGDTYSRYYNEEYYRIDNSNITGSVMFRIDAKVENDVTTKYLLIDKDDSAPVISLDDTVVYADSESGKYTVTGTTEAGAKVYCDEEEAATADADGRFSYSAKLELTREQFVLGEDGKPMYDENGHPITVTVPLDSGEILTMYAEDENGNQSGTQSVIVSLQGEAQTLDRLEIVQTPDKTAYGVGETFDRTGMIVHAFFADGSSMEVTDYLVEPDGALTAGTSSVTIRYTVGSITKTVSLPITVGGGSSSGGSSGSSSSGRSHEVSVASSTNGTVAVSPKNAKPGDTVTVTVKPDNGYTLETLTVTDAKGNQLTLTELGDGRYTFKMPSSKVDVKATFMEDNTMLNFFTDVSAGSYCYDAVLWAAKKGITGGVDENHFAPDAACTRAQIVTFLWRAAGSPEPKGASRFADVPSDSYYAKAVAWAVENGITTGMSDSVFSPDGTCTRAQSVTLLYRALGSKTESSASFRDVPANSWYADAVAWAVENDVTVGIGKGLFGPDAACTRGQIVTFLYRAYQGK